MDTVQTALLAEIDGFLADRQMKETTFGKLAVNDGKFVGRLRSGANVTVNTVQRVRDFIADRADPEPVRKAG